jgi:hypothetical protein
MLLSNHGTSELRHIQEKHALRMKLLNITKAIGHPDCMHGFLHGKVITSMRQLFVRINIMPSRYKVDRLMY